MPKAGTDGSFLTVSGSAKLAKSGDDLPKAGKSARFAGVIFFSVTKIKTTFKYEHC
jgi:hypothetical protein